MFDVSHMGRLYLVGEAAENLVERICTRRIGDMVAGQSRYSQVCNETGGILDDVIVTRFDDRFLIVCNASNREKICSWIQGHIGNDDVMLIDDTTSTAMLAVQGPRTLEVAGEMLPFDISDIKRYHTRTGRYLGIDYTCSRTGYTGEDGFEIIVSGATGMMVASNALDPEDSDTALVTPAGLGARDTLRLEAGMPLYGQELGEHIDPISAAQAWCVDLNKEFIGADALRRIAEQGPRRCLVGLELEGRRIARTHAALLVGENPVGEVTSGTWSPTLERTIAMGYVDEEHATEGTALVVDIRGSRVDGRIVPLPFYKRQRQRTTA
jgi:aminomethyltransferase